MCFSKDKIQLSIIIPAYNAERYLEKCLESIVKDSDSSDYEVIIINDGSKDRTEDIARLYSSQYSQVTFYTRGNEGVSSARNDGMKCANGKYLMFVDADDILYRNGLTAVLKSLETGSDFILYNYKEIYKEGEHEVNIDIASKVRQFEQLKMLFLSGHYLNTCWAKAFKKEIIDENSIRFDTNMRIGEDVVFVADYLEKAKNHIAVDKYIYGYRQTDSGAVNTSRTTFSKERVRDIEIGINRKKQFIVNSSLPEEAYDKLLFEYAAFISASSNLMIKGKRTWKVKWQELNILLSCQAASDIISNGKECKAIPTRRRILFLIIENKQLRFIYFIVKHFLVRIFK